MATRYATVAASGICCQARRDRADRRRWSSAPLRPANMHRCSRRRSPQLPIILSGVLTSGTAEVASPERRLPAAIRQDDWPTADLPRLRRYTPTLTGYVSMFSADGPSDASDGGLRLVSPVARARSCRLGLRPAAGQIGSAPSRSADLGANVGAFPPCPAPSLLQGRASTPVRTPAHTWSRQASLASSSWSRVSRRCNPFDGPPGDWQRRAAHELGNGLGDCPQGLMHQTSGRCEVAGQFRRLCIGQAPVSSAT